MFKKTILIMLIAWTMLIFGGCGTTRIRANCGCDCECCECGCDWEEDERYDDPGEYEGWRD